MALMSEYGPAGQRSSSSQARSTGPKGAKGAPPPTGCIPFLGTLALPFPPAISPTALTPALSRRHLPQGPRERRRSPHLPRPLLARDRRRRRRRRGPRVRRRPGRVRAPPALTRGRRAPTARQRAQVPHGRRGRPEGHHLPGVEREVYVGARGEAVLAHGEDSGALPLSAPPLPLLPLPPLSLVPSPSAIAFRGLDH